jgi:RNA polymerase sigma-70 factor (ECF subfamily)
MAALSPPEGAALTLAYRDGASHAEVASILGCPLGTAKTHILRGKEKLERQMSAWASERKP